MNRLLVIVLPLLTECAPPPRPAMSAATRHALDHNVALFDSLTPMVRFDPPPIYAMWMAEVEQCSGLKRSTDTLTYWIAPRVLIKPDGRLAEYVNSTQMIVFGLGSESVAWIVRHEALHHLLGGVGLSGHPPEYYGGPDVDGELVPGKCQQIVNPPTRTAGP